MARLLSGDTVGCLNDLNRSYALIRENFDIVSLALAVSVSTIALDRIGNDSRASRLLGHLQQLNRVYGAPINPFEQQLIDASKIKPDDFSKETVNQDQILSYAAECILAASADVRLQ
jgi:hypothetical protein